MNSVPSNCVTLRRALWFVFHLWIASATTKGAAAQSPTEPPYQEAYRPQVHFTAARNWLNDPNGLVFFRGEYHLFFQYNPAGNEGTGINMHWGHAVSPDLVHWKELPIALSPIGEHQRWSGTAVVDWQNSAGLQQGPEPPLLAFHTLTGLGQSLAYSNDRGRTWTDYSHNPLVAGDGRDPKVFWHEETHRWIMVYYEGTSYHIYGSSNLRNWERLSEIEGFYECPDLFPLPVDGNPAARKWVLVNGSGEYVIGDFDGVRFKAQGPRLRGDWGANYYATQTWNDIPEKDGRRIQIAWMRGGVYPGMPFNQQMTFPCELSLRTFPEGIRLCKTPVREIDVLRRKGQHWEDIALNPGANPLEAVKGDLFLIVAEIDPGDARGVGFEVRGQRVWYSADDRKIHAFGAAVDCAPVHKTLKMELLLDRTSIEFFIDGGRVSGSSCYVEAPQARDMAVFAHGGTAKLVSMQVDPLSSAWGDAGAGYGK